jgi:renalase
MHATRSIAVIGAGLAGLSCATALREQGHRVQVFEKSRGVGGRMSTRNFESWACDHGAQYFTARDPSFAQQVDIWLKAGAAALWDAQITSFDAQGWQTIQSSSGRYVGTPSMTAPAKHLARGLEIHFSTTIDQLLRQDQVWKLHCKERGLLETHFDTLVLAIPSKQAEPLVQPHSATLYTRCQDAVMCMQTRDFRWHLMPHSSTKGCSSGSPEAQANRNANPAKRGSPMRPPNGVWRMSI